MDDKTLKQPVEKVLTEMVGRKFEISEKGKDLTKEFFEERRA